MTVSVSEFSDRAPSLYDEPRSPTDRDCSELFRGELHRVAELCPRLCPNGCLRSTNTVTYGETPRDNFPVLNL
jgi:hypothetical protein